MTPGFLELAASLAVVIAASPPPADPTKPPPCGYSVEFYVAPDCGIFSTTVKAVRINENGVAIGEREGCPTPSNDRAFIWWPDGSVALITLPSWTSFLGATDFNDEGIALLSANAIDPNDGFAALLYDGKQYFELAYPDWAISIEAGGLANGNLVGGSFGHSVTGPFPLPAYWDQAGFHDLSEWFKDDLSVSVVDINAVGAVVGTITPPIPPDPVNDLKRAYFCDGESVTVLPPSPGAMNSLAKAISDAGHVIGYGHPVGGPSGPWKAFIWCDGQMETLPPLAVFDHDDTIANDVNIHGVAVGRSEREQSPSNSRVVVWFSNVPHELEPMVDWPANSGIAHAWGINDLGQIVGRGFVGSKHAAVRLSPRPSLFGDLTADCEVNSKDVAVLFEQWGDVAEKSNVLSDLDADGLVDASDLGLLLSAWTGASAGAN